MAIIKFFNFPENLTPRLKECVLAVLKSEKINNYSINIIMISDKNIKKLNIKYRKTSRITDVISFLIDPASFIGDIYIAKDRSKKQAIAFNHSWFEELAYLTIHGTLHLCGYSDYDVKNKKRMFKKQDKIFKCLFY